MDIKSQRIGVLGATSPAGRELLALLQAQGHEVFACSRNPPPSQPGPGVQWINLSLEDVAVQFGDAPVPVWISCASIWVSRDYLSLMQRTGARHVTCLSSTSRYTKGGGSNTYEDSLVARLVEGERVLEDWATANGIAWTVLRPTLIYGHNTDRNLSEIVRLIGRLRCFPLFGGGKGLRQPVYVDDVAKAASQAAQSSAASNKAYNISGAEVLSYREMVTRVFQALGQRPVFLVVPIWLFKCALVALRMLPRYRRWNADMVLRMNRDMVFDHSEARRDFGFDPQPFVLRDVDVGR